MTECFGEHELESGDAIEYAAPDEEPERPSVVEGRFREMEERCEGFLLTVGGGAVRGSCVAPVDAERQVEVGREGT